MGSVSESVVGGGGIVGISTEWQNVYYRDFSTLSNQDLLSGGDGTKTIDVDKQWTLANSANATSVDVGETAGGIKIVQPAATSRTLFQGNRTSPWLRSKLAQYFTNTIFEKRRDVEVMLSFRRIYGGTISGSGEDLILGLTTSTYNANFYHTLLQGDDGGSKFINGTHIPGTLTGGLNALTGATTPPLTYYPNCLRITLEDDDYTLVEYSDDGAASLAVAQWTPLLWKQRTTVQRPILNPGSVGSELEIYFGIHKNSAGGGITDMTLVEMQIDARFSARSGTVFLT